MRKPPADPSELSDMSRRAVLRRTVREFRADGLADWAAALTYYAVLSLFPALLALVSLVGLVGESATEPLLRNLEGFTPGPGREMATRVVRTLAENQGGAGFFSLLGIAAAMWSASAYVGAFMRASNAVFDMPEGRPLWKALPIRVGLTAGIVVTLAATALATLFTGALADRIGALVGLGHTGVAIWVVLKWPLLLALVTLLLGVLYWAAPNVRQPGLAWVAPGVTLAVVLWAVASGGFAAYVSYIATYNRTYGALAGVVVFLVWLWLTNVIVLVGLELNAELIRERAILAGIAADNEPYVEPRDDTRLAEEDTPAVRESE